jgi:glycosyltransferase involved in cell wall biosynthesis
VKIAMVSEHASPLATLGGVDAGGQNVHVAELAGALADRGHQVVVYTRRDDAELPRRVALRHGVWVEHLDAGPPRAIAKDDLLPYIPALGRALAIRLGADRPDVVHAHFWMSGVAACAAARSLHIPVVQTFHALGAVKRRYQGAADTSPPSRVDDERQVAREVNRVIASCTDEADELIAMDCPRTSIDIVPSGVDLELFTPDGPVAPRDPATRRLLVVGRLVPRKGVADAVRVCALLPEDVELVVAGGPEVQYLAADPEASRLLALAEDLSVRDRVHFVGRVARPDLPALVRSADVVVCLPWYEPFGIVPLESMASGVPVVGSAVGGLMDTVVDDVTGLLVPPRRPEAAARAIRALLDDTTVRRRMAICARARAENYSWQAVARLTEATYRRASVVGARSTAYEEVVG